MLRKSVPIRRAVTLPSCVFYCRSFDFIHFRRDRCPDAVSAADPAPLLLRPDHSYGTTAAATGPLLLLLLLLLLLQDHCCCSCTTAAAPGPLYSTTAAGTGPLLLRNWLRTLLTKVVDFTCTSDYSPPVLQTSATNVLRVHSSIYVYTYVLYCTKGLPFHPKNKNRIKGRTLSAVKLQETNYIIYTVYITS